MAIPNPAHHVAARFISRSRTVYPSCSLAQKGYTSLCRGVFMPQRQQIGRNGTITELRRLVPVSQLLQGFRQILCKGAGHYYPGFQVEALDFEHALLAMGLGIHSAHQLAAMEQGQHEVAVLTLGGRV